MGRGWCAVGLAAVLLAGATAARSEVLSESANGFHVRTIVESVPLPPARIAAAVRAMPQWWPARQAFGGALSLDLRPGGCFCERFEQGGVQHLSVTRVMENEVWFNGAIGPLAEYGLSGSLHIVWGSAVGGSFVTVDYWVGGYAPPDRMHALAIEIDGAVGEQAAALAGYAQNPADRGRRRR